MLRRHHGVEGMRRLRVHPGLRRRLQRSGPHRAAGHEQTQLPQIELRGGLDYACAPGGGKRGAGPHRVVGNRLENRRPDEGRQEGKREEAGATAALAGRRRGRPPALRAGGGVNRFLSIRREKAMKIQIVQKGTKGVSSKSACPWYVD